MNVSQCDHTFRPFPNLVVEYSHESLRRLHIQHLKHASLSTPPLALSTKHRSTLKKTHTPSLPYLPRATFPSPNPLTIHRPPYLPSKRKTIHLPFNSTTQPKKKTPQRIDPPELAFYKNLSYPNLSAQPSASKSTMTDHLSPSLESRAPKRCGIYML